MCILKLRSDSMQFNCYFFGVNRPLVSLTADFINGGLQELQRSF